MQHQVVLTKKKCLLLGSIPLSLNEVTLSPAILSAHIKSKGHDFEYIDVNLELYKSCGRDQNLYYEKIECLQDFEFSNYDTILDKWIKQIEEKIKSADYLLINVFSHLSQAVALMFVELTKKINPCAVIIIGGVGSQKYLNNSTSKQTLSWIKKYFGDSSSFIFGELLLKNKLINYWQHDVSTSVIDSAIPSLINTEKFNGEFDFSVYQLDEYKWVGEKSLPLLGSHGCVRQCSFCDVIKHFPKYSFVEADDLTKNIVDAYQTTGITKFNFMDSLVNGSMENFEHLLKNLIHSKKQGWLPENFKWNGTYICRPQSQRLDRIHKLLKSSGAETLVIGVESGSDDVRFQMKKKFTNRDLIHELKGFKEHGVKAILLFFPAWPTETLRNFKETLDLLYQIREYAQSNTVEDISLSSHGFTLIDGTGIDKDKHKIGLTPGPLTWLWHCTSNPTLNFWESLRRRLLTIEVAMYYGITVNDENRIRRQLITSLELHHNTVLEYTGPLLDDIMDFSITLTKLDNFHLLKFDVTNSGQITQNLTISTLSKSQHYTCKPGITSIEFEFQKTFETEEILSMNFRFDDSYSANFKQYENGDYYSTNGLYLDNIFVDYRNVTFWGFNQITDESVFNIELPDNYYKYVNQRCIVGNTTLFWNIQPDESLHNFIWKKLNPELAKEKMFVDNKLKRTLKKFRNNTDKKN